MERRRRGRGGERNVSSIYVFLYHLVAVVVAVARGDREC